MPGVPPGAIAERRIIDRLLRANAISPSAGIVLENLRWVEARRLGKLVALGVIREEDGGRYYLFAPALAERMRSRRRRIVAALLVVVLLMFLAAALVAPGVR
jgi:hypothetical protein